MIGIRYNTAAQEQFLSANVVDNALFVDPDEYNESYSICWMIVLIFIYKKILRYNSNVILKKINEKFIGCLVLFEN